MYEEEKLTINSKIVKVIDKQAFIDRNGYQFQHSFHKFRP